LANWNGFLTPLTEHVYLNRGYFFQLADVQTLWEYYDDTGLFATDDNLSARLLAQRSTAIDALFNAADKSAAYTALDAILEAEIDQIDTDDQIKAHMKSAMEALINPNQSTLLDLLYTQDTDLFGYPGDCSAGGGDGYLTAIISTTPSPGSSGNPTALSDENYLLGAPDDLGCYLSDAGSNTITTIEADFGQVYENAIRLDLRVRSDQLASAGRRLYTGTFFVKEAVEDDWVNVGVAYFNQTDLDDFEWHLRTVTFAAQNIRYVQMQFNRGSNTFHKYGWLWFDSLQVTVE